MTESAVVDAAQRQRALDPGESFIVQAPAGSGKTELLTQRYLRLLATVRQPEEICAITFTRKAAAEMRNRILAALAAARTAAPQAAHARLTWSLARAAMQRDAELDWQLERNPNRLRIQTFDSLAHALARQMPILSEYGATPGTTEQAEPYYRTAARATLRLLEDPRLGPHLERLLVHLDSRQAQLEDLLCDLLPRRDQWLSHVLRSPDGRELEDALRRAVTDQLRLLADSCGRDWLLALCAVARRAADNLAGRANTSGGLRTWQEREVPPGTDWEDLPAWQGLAELLLTTGGGVRKRWDARQGFPAPTEKGIDAEEQARRKQTKADIQELTGPLADDPQLSAQWHALRRLPAHGLDDTQHAVLGSLFQVLLHAVAELALAFREGGEVDFAETQMRAQRALGTPDAPTDLALVLDYRLQHLLVDEFQDTSSSQYRLLETLTANWQPGDGRTLFAVGDPMQSIYRFREAEVGLYLAARASGIGQLRLTPLTLAVNFRSSEAIVDWVNRGFVQLFPTRVDIGRGAVTYAPAHAFDRSHDRDAVRVHPFAANDPVAEAERLVALVRQALGETEQGQVAVLARARSHLHAIAVALKQAGLAFQAVDVDLLAGQPVVQDLYHLTRALLHPADRLAWLVVLRAPWLGLDLSDLLTIAESSPRCVLQRLQDPQLRAQLSADGRRRVERLLAIVGPQLPARGRRPLRQWVEGIWLRLGGAALVGARGRDDAQAFLALLDQHQTAGGLQDFTRLESAMDALYAAPDSLADGRIQLMTMHKSKGLEFDTVILPGLGRRPRTAAAELLYWLERPDADGEVSLLMAPIRAAQQAAEPISDYLRELDRDKSRLETTRLLYVAATRAKRRLHLLGHIPFNDRGEPGRPAADSLLEKLWPIVAADFAALAPPPADALAPTLTGHRQLQRLADDWQPDWQALGGSIGTEDAPPPPPEEIEFDWAGDTARHVGTLVHRQLERIASDGVDAWPAERVDELEPIVTLGLRHLGVDAGELVAAVDKALRALRLTLEHDTGRWILGRHAEAHSEWPLTVHEETTRHYVIDRTFVDDDGIRWIIDYKTGEHLDLDREAFLDGEQERYRGQLDNYARIVHMLESRPIRLALYFPLFADWRVWDFNT